MSQTRTNILHINASSYPDADDCVSTQIPYFDRMPFGKHVGELIHTIPLTDPGYCEWLINKADFRDKYPGICAAWSRVANIQPTSKHNRGQAKFIDPEYRESFVKVAIPEWKEGPIREFRRSAESFLQDIKKAHVIDEYTDYMGDIREVAEQIVRLSKTTYVHMTTKAQFEIGNVDITITARTELKHQVFINEGGLPRRLRGFANQKKLKIEYKPEVGNDIFTVVRQVSKNGSEYLFVGEYLGTDVSKEHFVAIFAENGKTVVFQEDVEAEYRQKMEQPIYEINEDPYELESMLD